MRWPDKKLEADLRELGKLPPSLALRRVTDTIIEELPKVMFLLLPFFALLLKLIYMRRRRYYVEHFVFALHVHAHAFVLFALMLVFNYGWLKTLCTGAIMIYTFIAMKRVYQQGYFKTSVKWGLLAACYTIVLALSIALIWALAATSAT